jgi:hypothetical protein
LSTCSGINNNIWNIKFIFSCIHFFFFCMYKYFYFEFLLIIKKNEVWSSTMEKKIYIYLKVCDQLFCRIKEKKATMIQLYTYTYVVDFYSFVYFDIDRPLECHEMTFLFFVNKSLSVKRPMNHHIIIG